MKFLFACFCVNLFILGFCEINNNNQVATKTGPVEILRHKSLELDSNELRRADSVRAASGYAWNERHRFMERYWCRGKCIDMFYSTDTTISAKWDESKSHCICNFHPK